jgi:hypothetical protein
MPSHSPYRIDLRPQTKGTSSIYRALQFSHYLLERIGILARDKNARPGIVKLIQCSRFRAFLAPFKKRDKNARPGIVKLIQCSRFRAFLAPFKKRELRCPIKRYDPLP